MHNFLNVKENFRTHFVSSPEDHVLLDGVHLVLVIRPSRVHVLYHGANVADNGRDNKNTWMVCFMVKIWSKMEFYQRENQL